MTNPFGDRSEANAYATLSNANIGFDGPMEPGQVYESKVSPNTAHYGLFDVMSDESGTMQILASIDGEIWTSISTASHNGASETFNNGEFGFKRLPLFYYLSFGNYIKYRYTNGSTLAERVVVSTYRPEK